MVFTINATNAGLSIVVSNADGSGQRDIVDYSERRQVCCARWTPDSRYIVYEDRTNRRVDLWAAEVQTGFLQRLTPPVQLPMVPCPTRAQSQARMGNRSSPLAPSDAGGSFDMTSMRNSSCLFFLASRLWNPTFSRDGKWVAYASYPDHTLVAQSSDGTDRLQLTNSPMGVW